MYATAYNPAKTAQVNKPPTPVHAYQILYANSRALGRAVARSKLSQPTSPRKATEVISVLAGSVSLLPKRPRQSTGISTFPQLKYLVVQFYGRDDISRQAPGYKDFVTVRVDRKKHQVQKRHLVMTIREAHALFTEEHGEEHKIGNSKFAELRPEHVLHTRACLPLSNPRKLQLHAGRIGSNPRKYIPWRIACLSRIL